ncbi:hypothetical protein ACHAWF_002104 [Thalassiosira exigua]
MASQSSDPPTNGPAASIVMRGYMMKKKRERSPSGEYLALRRSVGSKWARRYYVLTAGGKLLYWRERPSPDEETRIARLYDGSGDDVEGATGSALVMWLNVAECSIDHATLSDVADSGDVVPNSFYFHRGLMHKWSTLLVANGPEDFVMWIRAFRQLGASIHAGLAGPSEAPHNSIPVKEVEKNDVEGDTSAVDLVADSTALHENLLAAGAAAMRESNAMELETDADLREGSDGEMERVMEGLRLQQESLSKFADAALEDIGTGGAVAASPTAISKEEETEAETPVSKDSSRADATGQIKVQMESVQHAKAKASWKGSTAWDKAMQQQLHHSHTSNRKS